MSILPLFYRRWREKSTFCNCRGKACGKIVNFHDAKKMLHDGEMGKNVLK